MSEPGGGGPPAEPPEACPPGPEARRDDEAVEIASEDSFPASDPPSTTPSHIGGPARSRKEEKPKAPDEVAPQADPSVPGTEREAREERARDPERAGTAGREG